MSGPQSCLFLFLQVVSYIKPHLHLFQAMTHLMYSPLCRCIVMPTTWDFSLSDVTNQDFVSFIKEVRNFCSNNMVELYDERIKMNCSVTVHWDGKFYITES
jgi:hypothetical protein